MPEIIVEHIAKKYKLNALQNNVTLRDKLTKFVKHPFDSIKKYGAKDFWALHDINFNVNKGDILGIIGKNGSGKSTLLKIISGIVSPTEGKIFFKGRVASLLEVGIGFHPELTGRENIFLNSAINKMSRREIKEKFGEIVEFSGIGKFLDTPIKFYSNGMYVRLAFAVAVHLNSDILLIDEVLSVGDYEFQKKCLKKINDLTKDDERTIIFVSHNLEAIKNLCNRAILLANGKIVEIDDTVNVIESYLKDFSENKNYLSYDFKAAPGNNLIKIKSLICFRMQ